MCKKEKKEKEKGGSYHTFKKENTLTCNPLQNRFFIPVADQGAVDHVCLGGKKRPNALRHTGTSAQVRAMREYDQSR